MRVFVTGATGFVGSAVVQELLGAGHTVLGLARNDAAADRLHRLGVAVQRGDLTDLGSLTDAANVCDAVIHTAFIHDFTNIAASGRTDLTAIEAIGDVLVGTNKRLVVTSGLAHAASGQISTEDEPPGRSARASHRTPSDEATLALAARGVRAMLVRLPPSVHGDGDHGFVPALIAIARASGVSAFVGDGLNRWPAVHRLDAAQLFRLAVEAGGAGATYHGVDDEGVPTRDIAAVIGGRLQLPVVSKTADEAAAHFGWLGAFFGADVPSSSALTRERLGWRPTHAALLADLDHERYFTS